MAQNQPSSPGRTSKKAIRYGVPVAVAGVAAATIGLVPALASSGDPDLPEITAEELIAKIAESDVDQLSGTVKASADLGLPALPGSSGGDRGGPFGGGDRDDKGEEGRGGDSRGAPQQKLMELASGEHTLRVAADGPDKQRVSVIAEAEEYSFIHNGKDVWTYDSASNSVYHAEAPEGAGEGGGEHDKAPAELADLTPQEAAKKALKAVDKTTSVSVDGSAKVAGRDAYQLLIKPKGAEHSTVGSIRIAVDAENGTPLKFTLSPKGGGSAVFDVRYTEVDFDKPDAGKFDFTPPKGAEVTEQKLDGEALEEAEKEAGKYGGDSAPSDASDLSDLSDVSELSGFQVLGEGWGTVAEIDLPGAAMLGGDGPGGFGGPDAKGPDGMDGADAAMAQRLLDGLTDEAKGEFGTGRVFETKLVNVLITEDGKVYAGAVTKDGLIKAADEAAK